MRRTGTYLCGERRPVLILKVVRGLQSFFGIVGICPVLKVNDEGFDQLSQEVIDYMAQYISG